MTTQHETVKRLARARREAFEAAEWLGRLESEAAAAPLPPAMEGVELVGSKEAYELAGMLANTFAVARKRGMVPPPLVTLACGPIWLKQTIVDWAAIRAAR